ncbi:MAG: hypothetical protein M3135_03225, partial [Actinomycetota bacterium]|nr:hypothetical protein [Actinomycetota bacterium]
MKTTRDLDWIWEEEEERFLEPDPLGDLTVTEAPSEPAAPGAQPADVDESGPSEDGQPKRRRGIRFRRSRKEGPPEASTETTDADDEVRLARAAPPQHEGANGRVRIRRRRIGAWSRWARFWGLVVLALVLGTVAPQIVELSTGGDAPQDAGAPPPVQRVAMWHVAGTDGDAHLAVFASGRKPPVVMAIPAEITINLPG